MGSLLREAFRPLGDQQLRDAESDIEFGMGPLLREPFRPSDDQQLRDAESDIEFGMGPLLREPLRTRSPSDHAAKKASTSSAHESAMQLYKDVNFEEAQRKHAQWVSMFGIKALAGRSRKSEPDVLRRSRLQQV